METASSTTRIKIVYSNSFPFAGMTQIRFGGCDLRLEQPPLNEIETNSSEQKEECQAHAGG